MIVFLSQIMIFSCANPVLEDTQVQALHGGVRCISQANQLAIYE